MKFYTKLTEKQAYGLTAGQFVYVTSDTFSLNRTPALVSESPFPDCIKVITCEPVSVILDKYAHHGAEYGKGWFLEVENGFSVDTPDGILHVYDKGCSDYPGAMVDLYPTKHPDERVGVTMVEYIPGGESVASYEPSKLDMMQRESAEVPMQRIAHEDGTPVALDEHIGLYNAASVKYQVTSGLVTRGWPDELHDEDTHERIFHYGYNAPINKD